MVTRIAIAVDLSVESHFAVRWALDLRNRLREREEAVEMFAISVPADRETFAFQSIPEYPDTTQDAGVHHWIVRRVRDFLETVDHRVDDIEIVAEEGEASEVIAGFCREHEIDWVTCGMEMKGAFARWILGSTVYELTDLTPCNLAVVHPEHARLKPPLQFACGIDFLPGSEAALFSASHLADVTDAHLHLVHALRDAPTGSNRGASLEELDPSDAKRLAVDARQSLEAMMEEVRLKYPKLDYSALVHGDSAKAVLVDYIREHHIDAAFLGRVDHSTFEKLLGASVGRQLLKRMPTTLVMVPPDRD